MPRRRLLGVAIVGWLAFCIWLGWRGVQQQGAVNYLDSGNVSSVFTSTALLSAVVWMRGWLNDKRAALRHAEHLAHLHHLCAHLGVPPVAGNVTGQHLGGVALTQQDNTQDAPQQPTSTDQAVQDGGQQQAEPGSPTAGEQAQQQIDTGIAEGQSSEPPQQQ